MIRFSENPLFSDIRAELAVKWIFKRVETTMESSQPKSSKECGSNKLQHVVRVKRSSLAFLLLGLSGFQAMPAIAQSVWDGTASTGDWTDQANWEGFFGGPNNTHSRDDLVFKGTKKLTNNNDFIRETFYTSTDGGGTRTHDFTVGDIIFDATAGEFRLRGNDLSVIGNITNKSSTEQNIDLKIFLEDSSTFKNTQSSGYLDINGRVNVGTDHTLTIDGGDIGFDGGIVGGGSLVKKGGGILSLDGTNSYSGGTSIEGGTIRLEGGDNLSGWVSIESGGKLDLNGTAESLFDLNNLGTVDLSGGASLYFYTGESTGDFYGSGSLSVDGFDNEALLNLQNALEMSSSEFKEYRTLSAATAVKLTGNNSYSGGTNVATGGVLLGNTNGIQGDINNNGIVVFDQDFQGSIGGSLVDDALGEWMIRGGGQVNLKNTLELYGDISVSEASTLGLTSDLQLGEIHLTDSTLQIRESLLNSKQLSISNSATVEVLADKTLNQNGRVEGPLLRKTGDGTLELTRSVATSVDISLEEGTLTATDSLNGSTLGRYNNLSIASGATYDMKNIRGTIGSLSGDGNITNMKELTVDEVGDSVFSGDITKGSSDSYFRKSGSGTLTLTGTGSSFATTYLSKGRLNVSNATNLGSDRVIFALNTVLGIQESFDSTFANLDLDRYNSTIDVAADKKFSMIASINNDSPVYTRTLNKAGAGTLKLDGGSTGGTVDIRVKEGTLEVGSGGGITGVRGLEIVYGAHLDATGATSYAGDLLNQGVVSGVDLTLSGNVSGAGSFEGGVRFSGIYGPGNSPALVNHGVSSFLSGATLSLELGGNTRGGEYDALDGEAFNLDGILAVSLIDFGGGTFIPELGDTFDLLRAATISGMFSVFDFSNAGLSAGLAWAWDIFEEHNDHVFRLSVTSTQASVPEPGMISLLALGLILLFRGSSYNIARPSRSPKKEDDGLNV